MILLYHSIASAPENPYTVTPQNFAAQMEVVARDFTPVGLSALDQAWSEGRLPARAVVVTFDDGYANNLHAAAPVLTRLGIPATVFVSTGFVGAAGEYWWDELPRLILAGLRRGHDASALPGAARAPDGAAPALRAELAWAELVRLDPEAIGDRMEGVRRWAGDTTRAPARETHRPLDRGELTALAAQPGIEIGSHTRRHPLLAAQPEVVQREELAGSRADLEAWLGQEVTSFAYPFGDPGADYDATTVALVGHAGYRCAVSTIPRPAGPDSPRLELPRCFVSDQPASEFASWLSTRFDPTWLRYSRRSVARLRRSRG